MKKVTDDELARKFIGLSESAKSRGIVFDLSLLSVKNMLMAEKCYYTGIKLSNNPKSNLSRSIDRIDNSKGYVKGNICACSKLFNGKKNDLTVEEIKILYKKVIRRRK